MIVPDTNVVAYLTIEGPATEAARAARARDEDWRVPPWWRSEFMNLLATGVRTGRTSTDAALATWGTALDLLDGAEVDPGDDAVLRTALRDRISAYDAWFVALADALDVPLVTSDRRLVIARPDRAVLLDDYAR